MAADTTPRWQEVEVVEAGDAAVGVRRLVLRYPNPQVARPGAHVDLEVWSGSDWLKRSYSVVEASCDGRDVVLSVQLAPRSRGGSRAMHALHAGDSLRATQPLQNFPLGVGAARFVLLAGGIGITAIHAMARAVRARGVDYNLVYVGRSREVMAYAKDVAAEHGDRARIHVDDEGDALDVDALLDDIAADERARAVELYLCGPIRLMDAVRRGWAARGLPATNLRFETFGNSGSWAPQDFIVRIPRLGVEARVGAQETMLEALEAGGVEMMFDCRKGECGLCQVSVLALDGHLDHRDVFLDQSERNAADRLCACVSRVVSAGTPRMQDDPEVTRADPGELAVVTIEVT